MTTCRSCEAEVVFVPSATTGNPMILDAKPAKGVVLQRVMPDGHATAAVVDVYTDHHATCPDAAAWKGKHR